MNANVGGKLNIESLQDEERFKTKSSGGGLEVEFGFGNNWSFSGYGNVSKGTTHRKKKGMHINVFGYTKGKGDKAINEVIPFNGNKDDFNRYLKQLNK